MIRNMVLGVSVLAVCLVAVGAAAQGTAKLTYADFTEPNAQLSQFVRRPVERLPVKQLKGVPDGLGSDAVYFAVEFGDVPVRILIDPAKESILYVDTDADLDLADEQAVKGIQGSKPWIVFLGAPAVVVGDKHVRCSVHSVITKVGEGRSIVRYACLGPAGACSGAATFGDAECAVALLDADFDGRYTVGADLLAIDANGNGRFEPAALEVAPLGDMARVGGVFYGVEVEADGSSITFTQTKPKLGALKADSEAVQVQLASRWGELRLSQSERDDAGAWPLPVGTYTVRRVTLTARDKAGTEWMLRGLRPSRANELEITEGETLALAVGLPLTLKSTVGMRRHTASVNVELVGQGGETYLAGVYKNGKQLGAPTLKILDEKGNVLASGVFGYG